MPVCMLAPANLTGVVWELSQKLVGLIVTTNWSAIFPQPPKGITPLGSFCDLSLDRLNVRVWLVAQDLSKFLWASLVLRLQTSGGPLVL